MASQRDLTLTGLLDDVSRELSNFAKWPESEGTKNEVDKTIKAMRKCLKEDSYPDVFRYMVATQIAAGLFNDCVNRDVKFSNFKMAWIKLAEIFE